MGKVTKSLVIGAALGAIAALLMAPRPGKQTRVMWQKKYAHILAQVARDIARAKKITKEQYELMVERAMKLAAKSKATKRELDALRAELIHTWHTLEKKMRG